MPNTHNTTEVAIIGGGAIGCAIAYYLAKTGTKTTIIEQHSIASQASGYNAGGLNPLQGTHIPGKLSNLAKTSFQMHTQLAQTLPQEANTPYHHKTITNIHIALQQTDIPPMQQTLNTFNTAGKNFHAHWLTTQDLLKIHPQINPAAIKGILTHGNASLLGYQYTLALSKAAQNLGTTIQTATATGIQTTNNRITAITLNNNTKLNCQTAVIATGPWASQAAQWLNTPIPIQPLKGEILRIKPTTPPPPHDLTAANTSIYMRADNLLWIGATEEHKGYDRTPSQTAKQTLLTGAAKIIPTLTNPQIIKHTACLRPTTPDNLPIIGKAPNWQNAYIATGAGKKGILLSPATGKAIADLITTGTTQIPLTGLSPQRFQNNTTTQTP